MSPFQIVKGGHIHDKGLESHADYYSAFKDQSRTRCTSLADDLIKRNVTNVYTCGIAYDFCVGECFYCIYEVCMYNLATSLDHWP